MAKDYSCARSVVIVIGLLLFVCLGGIGFLLDHFLRFPGLKNQVEQLEAQIKTLESEVDRLEGAIDDLEAQNVRYADLNGQLNATVGEFAAANTRFAGLNDQLNRSNVELQTISQDLGNQTAALEQVNQELMSIVDFINTTSSALFASLEQLTAYLDDGIAFYQAASLRAVELDYIVMMRSWSCDFRSTFRGEPFEVDDQVSIGLDRYDDVRSYLRDRLFDNVCLDIVNWEMYMANVVLQGTIETMTTDELTRGVANYTRQATEFYFPDGGKDVPGALEWTDWSAAEYACANLQRSFVWA
jgi:hypothetical protein